MFESRKAALATLPGYAPFPAEGLNWTDFADRIVADLLTFDACWFTDPKTGIKGFRPYVKGTDHRDVFRPLPRRVGCQRQAAGGLDVLRGVEDGFSCSLRFCLVEFGSRL